MGNKGITTTTLVITIIVLIIIASVTVSLVASNGGLLDRTKSEKSNFDSSIIRSNVKLAILKATEDGTITEQNLTSALDNKIGNGEYTLEAKTNGWIIRVNNEEFEVTNSGKIVSNNENGNNNQSGGQSVDPVVTQKNLASKVKIGDYVAYNPTVADAQGNVPVDSSKLTYTSYSNTDKVNVSGNGNKTQTFTVDSNIKWRVLSKNETTGEVVLTSEYVINVDDNEQFRLGGAKGYLYAEQELNEVCKIYGYGYGAKTDMVTTFEYGDLIADVDENGNLPTGTIVSGARCIKAEDIMQMFGEQPLNELDNKYGTKPYLHDMYYPTIANGLGASGGKTERSDEYTYYVYNCLNHLQDNGIKSYAQYNVLFENYVNNKGSLSFYLATRYVESLESKVRFGVMKGTGGYIQGMQIITDSSCRSEWYLSNDFCSAPIRPLVYLDPTIETSGKNAAGAWVLK